MKQNLTIGLILALMTGTAVSVHADRANAPGIFQVKLLRTPNEGIQPQTVLDRDGVLHMIYVKGDASAGDIEYVSRKVYEKDFSDTMPVFFSRLNDSGTAFETQRNLMQYAKGGDGGLSVAADALGDVYAVWHAVGAEPGEDHRRVY